MASSTTVAKYIIFVANVFFALPGLALVAQGVAVHVATSTVSDIGMVTIFIGLVVFLIAFLGCCGAITENKCLLIAYSVCLLVLMILKIVLAILIFVYRDYVNQNLVIVSNAGFNRNRDAFHHIEEAYRCCGTTGAFAYPSSRLPSSCCESNAYRTTCTVANAFEGCNDVILKHVNTAFSVSGGVVIAIAAVELLTVYFSLRIASQSKPQQGHKY